VPYFFNSESNTSSWDPPSGFTEEQIAKLPGAAQYLSRSGGTASGGAAAPGQVRASHLLVKHRDSRNPSSWKEKQITRTKEEAIEILRGYQAEINNDANKFTELAGKHSDCSSHKADGDLGFFGRGAMQKPFEEGTYALEVGQISDVVSTDSGVHLIMRTG
jgi:NIMA-interacting peptidyl-prolyl cis-trans isomerase 1